MRDTRPTKAAFSAKASEKKKKPSADDDGLRGTEQMAMCSEDGGLCGSRGAEQHVPPEAINVEDSQCLPPAAEASSDM